MNDGRLRFESLPSIIMDDRVLKIFSSREKTTEWRSERYDNIWIYVYMEGGQLACIFLQWEARDTWNNLNKQLQTQSES